MADIQKIAYFDGEYLPVEQAQISVASSAVMYGLSVYSVFFARKIERGFLGFRVKEHFERLQASARMIGLNGTEDTISYDDFLGVIRMLAEKNAPSEDQFFRVTIHASDLVAGVRTSDLTLKLSVFMYTAENILPQDRARLKTSLWRRTADTAIPARAKVNGAYVNSALAKQDAIDAGFDDCLFLNKEGFVSELSAANIAMVKHGIIHTPDSSSDILEGITRRSVIEWAKEQGIEVRERKIALTEMYTADEVFACGTSAFVSPIVEIDGRVIGSGAPGVVTASLRERLVQIQADESHDWTTLL